MRRTLAFLAFLCLYVIVLGRSLRTPLNAEASTSQSTLIYTTNPAFSSIDYFSFPRYTVNTARWNSQINTDTRGQVINLGKRQGDGIKRGYVADGLEKKFVTPPGNVDNWNRSVYLAAEKSLAAAMMTLELETYKKHLEGLEDTDAVIFARPNMMRMERNQAFGIAQRPGLMASRASGTLDRFPRRGQILSQCMSYYLDTKVTILLDKNNEQVSENGDVEFTIFFPRCPEGPCAFDNRSRNIGVSFTTSDVVTRERPIEEMLGEVYQAAKVVHRKDPFGRGALNTETWMNDPFAQSNGPSQLYSLCIGKIDSDINETRSVNITSQLENRTLNFQMRTVKIGDPLSRRAKQACLQAQARIPKMERDLFDRTTFLADQDVWRESEAHDPFELIFSITALMASIFTTASFAASRWRFGVKIVVEIADLIIGALPGAVILMKGLSKGELHSTVMLTESGITPTAATKNMNVSMDGVLTRNEVFLPVFASECFGVGIWTASNRSWFLAVYVFGLILGSSIVVVQLILHRRSVKKILRIAATRKLTHTKLQCEECGYSPPSSDIPPESMDHMHLTSAIVR